MKSITEGWKSIPGRLLLMREVVVVVGGVVVKCRKATTMVFSIQGKYDASRKHSSPVAVGQKRCQGVAANRSPGWQRSTDAHQSFEPWSVV